MRGVYSFTLVFVFAACVVAMAGVAGIARAKLAEGSLAAMEIERASFLRFQLEENTDSIIGETIENEIRAGNREGAVLNEKISGSLTAYFDAIEKEQGLGGSIEFFEISTSGLSVQFTPATENIKKIENLAQYCKTVVVNAKEHVFLVQFRFTGGLMKNRAVLGIIRVGGSEQYFLLLPGYSIDRTVVV
ncbi:MAG: hypothetical protein NT067_05840 [Candidatus Diapherotrites archaeon]|nr:hypothetical protein [Candidatus Diapherotrites archaeon]